MGIESMNVQPIL